MKKTILSDAETVIHILQDEIRRSFQARYDHRLHAMLLVAQGLSCRNVSELLGDAPRTVAYWVRRFETQGLAGLADDDRPGRTPRLGAEHMEQIQQALRLSPTDYGITGNLWDGKLLSHFIEQQFGIQLGARQCQRMFRQLEFRLRKPRPLIAKADPVLQHDFKKNR